MQTPSEFPENDPSEDHEFDLLDNVYGPSQRDIDRSWENYETGGGRKRLGGWAWKLIIVAVSLVVLGSMSIGILGPLINGSDSSQTAPPDRVDANVLRVIDGRTIVVDTSDGEQTVRMIGVGSAEYGDPFFSFGQEVTQSWIGGKEVQLESDQLKGDEQGRQMRYVFIDNVMINAALRLNGLAKAETEHPNIRYDGYLADMERQAKESGVGIWDISFGNEIEAGDSQTLNEQSETQSESTS
jgi:endonuclease YncB( thermonuclease family)